MSYSYERLDKIISYGRGYFALVDDYADEEINYLQLHDYNHFSTHMNNKVFINSEAVKRIGSKPEDLYKQIVRVGALSSITCYTNGGEYLTREL